MSNKQKDEAKRLEEQYLGITKQLNQFKEAKLPPCPHCKSVETASVQVGCWADDHPGLSHEKDKTYS